MHFPIRFFMVGLLYINMISSSEVPQSSFFFHIGKQMHKISGPLLIVCFSGIIGNWIRKHRSIPFIRMPKQIQEDYRNIKSILLWHKFMELQGCPIRSIPLFIEENKGMFPYYRDLEDERNILIKKFKEKIEGIKKLEDIKKYLFVEDYRDNQQLNYFMHEDLNEIKMLDIADEVKDDCNFTVFCKGFDANTWTDFTQIQNITLLLQFGLKSIFSFLELCFLPIAVYYFKSNK